MNKTLKFSVLILVFALPIAITLFLKLFGESQFNVPILFQTEAEVQNRAAGCGPINYPYQLSVSELQSNLGISESLTKYDFVLFLIADTQLHEENEIVFQQIRTRTENKNYLLVGLSQKEMFKNTPTWYVKANASPDVLRQTKECTFMFPYESGVVLLDRKGQIRSHTPLKRKKLIDLVSEIDIISINNANNK